ncbi:hypothetical protein GCM10010429_25680 [Micromonospora olivasterospora]|uniref:Uncharacterized protein n=1 Tax=Micromonospora olivasterospora TaxID=1880 RepID=A0A562IHD5_MICOL|nr:hypothetical protein [Micromonospora olivasterospora]TWH70238.1 hypothetical protein JD77_05259 [Micromonospora olivasterospora]
MDVAQHEQRTRIVLADRNQQVTICVALDFIHLPCDVYRTSLQGSVERGSADAQVLGDGSNRLERILALAEELSVWTIEALMAKPDEQVAWESLLGRPPARPR